MDPQRRKVYQEVTRMIDGMDKRPADYAQPSQWIFAVRQTWDGIPNRDQLHAIHALAWETWEAARGKNDDDPEREGETLDEWAERRTGKTISELNDDERRRLFESVISQAATAPIELEPEEPTPEEIVRRKQLARKAWENPRPEPHTQTVKVMNALAHVLFTCPYCHTTQAARLTLEPTTQLVRCDAEDNPGCTRLFAVRLETRITTTAYPLPEELR